MIRYAKKEDLPAVNRLRRQVNELHVAGRPDIFKAGWRDELRDYLDVIWNDPNQSIAVAEQDGEIVGFAVLHLIEKPENPFMKARRFLDVDEFGVDENHRRQGIASEMMEFIKHHAREAGIDKLELNMWEFNEGALAFYERAGFKTYRRYMEMELRS